MNEFKLYKPRKIDFHGIQKAGNWHIKVYTITVNEKFGSLLTLTTVIENLEELFVKNANSSVLSTHRSAFVIIHEAKEGVWILFSWWTDGEMLATLVRFASFDHPTKIVPSPHEYALVCIWELEVYMHERKAWIQNVLMQASSPDFNGYLKDNLILESV